MRLAFHFHRPLSELNISLREFYAWMAYFDLEPPDEAENRRTASLMAQITNMAGKSLQKGRTVTAEDFLGRKQQPQRQSAEDQKAFFRALGKQDGS